MIFSKKQTFILLIICFFYWTKTNAQKICVDNNEICKMEKVEKGDFITITIEDLNPLIYQYVIKSKDSIIQMDTQPAMISGMLGLDKLGSLIANLSSVSVKLIQSTTDVAANETISNEHEIIKYSYQAPIVNDDRNCLTLFTEHLKKLHVRPVDINKVKALSEENACQINNIMLHPIAEINNTLYDLAKGYQNASFDMQLAAKTWKYKEPVTLDYDYHEVRQHINKLKQHQNINNQLIKEYPWKERFGKDSTAIKQVLINLNSKNKKGIAILDSTLSINNISTTLSMYENYTTFKEYTSLPIQINNNQKITVDIVPHSKTTIAPSYSTTFNVEVEQDYYVGFSSGFFYSAHTDDRYSIANIDSSYYIANEGPTKARMGIAAMAHIGKKLWRDDLHLGFAMGPTLAIRKPLLPGIAAALNLSYGEKNKVNFATGVNFSYVDRTSRIVEEGQIYTTAPQAIIQQIEPAFFIYVGYNFLTF